MRKQRGYGASGDYEIRANMAMRKLHLSGCPLSSLEPLESCPNLIYVEVKETPISYEEVTRFRKAIDRLIWVRRY